jgi:AraC-like DNA-binding protein
MRTLTQTGHLPPAERFAHWRAAILRLPVPFEIRAATADLRAEMTTTDLGPIRVMSLLSHTRYEFHRTRPLIRRSDPEAYRLILAVQGHGALAHEDRHVQLHPGDLVLCDTSRPFGGWRGVSGERVEWLLLTFPRSLLPLPAKIAGRLVGARLPGQSGLGRLASGFLQQVAEQADIAESSDGPRLATAALDLLAALLAHELEAGTMTSPESRRHALVLQIRDFIVSRLSDPDLSPDIIAAAHHISTRQLHKLFSAQDETVAAWVRSRRLAACQRDLSDPLLREQPVHAIAARWGFTSAAHFSRVFRGANGVTPQDFRRRIAAAANCPSLHDNGRQVCINRQSSNALRQRLPADIQSGWCSQESEGR